MSEATNTAPLDAKLRALEIESELAEMKRRYIVDRKQGDFRRRTELEAELAALSVVRHKERVEAAAQKALAIEVKGKSFMALLCRKVEDAGLQHLIKEAQDESLEHLKAAGLYDAYSSKVGTEYRRLTSLPLTPNT
jgi:hypothetical protein